MKLSQPLRITNYGQHYISLSWLHQFGTIWNNLQKELKRCANSTHFRQNVLYSEDVNKNPSQLFALPDLNVFLIYQYHYLPKKNIYLAKKQSFDDVNFAITLFWTIKSQKSSLLGEKKNSKPKNCLKNFLIMWFN